MSDQPVQINDALLSAEDVRADYLSLRHAIFGDGPLSKSLPVSEDTLMLVNELVKVGVCQSEAEVISRAVCAFFVAVFPSGQERQRILRESVLDYSPTPTPHA